MREARPGAGVGRSAGEDLGRGLKSVGGYGTIGLELVVGLLLSLAVGHWLDTKLGSEPWGLLAGALFGLATGVRALVRVNRRAIREALEEERRVGNPRPEIPYPTQDEDETVRPKPTEEEPS